MIAKGGTKKGLVELLNSERITRARHHWIAREAENKKCGLLYGKII